MLNITDFLNISHRKNSFNRINFHKEQLRIEIEEFYAKGMYFYVIDEVKR